MLCTAKDELIFQTGFEPSSEGIPSNAIQYFSGTDSSKSIKNNWTLDLEQHPNIGNFSIQYQGGDTTQRYAQIAKDPTNPDNHALLFWLKAPNVNGAKGRIQANLYNNNCLEEFYYSVSMFLDNDFNILVNAPEQFDWLTIFEFWNNANWNAEKFPFRISVDLVKNSAEIGVPLTFGIHAQTFEDNKWTNVWNLNRADIQVPLNEWFKAEIYFKQGNENNGEFFFAITPDGGTQTEIFNITNFTHHPDDKHPDGVAHLNPFKLYTSDDIINYVDSQNGVLKIFWDDFELWNKHKP